MYTAPYILPKVKTEDAKKDDFSYNRRIENEYNRILDRVSARVSEILKSYDPNNPASAVGILQSLEDYTNDLYDWAANIVGKVIYNLNEDDKRLWRKVSSSMSYGAKRELEAAPIGPLMEQYLKDNVGLIQSMPLRAAERVQRLVVENLETGKYRAEGLAQQIMNIGNVTRNRAKLIARTEVSRISTGLTKARSEVLDIGWYIWRTSRDVRVRSSHRLMNTVLVSWTNPPSPESLAGEKSYGNYHAGETFNCRCFPQPLIRIDDISWPARIYHNGQLRNINKSEFMELSAGQVPMAA